MKKSKKFEHEWFIYSSVMITCSLVFIVIHITQGSSQILGVSMAPVVGGAFALSDNWKNMPIAIHKWAIVISLLSVFIFIGILRSKNNEKLF